MSTSEQAREDATSLDDQERRARAYAEAQGWDVVDIFADPGVSGAKALEDRPAGARLMAAVESGEVDAIVVLKVDRFTRSLSSGSTTIVRLQELGCGFAAVEESFDTSTSTGELMLNILMTFAHFERQRIAERMADGRAATVERSRDEDGRATRWVGGAPPLGYMTEDGLILEDPQHAPTVRRIFELRATGISSTAIARKLQDEGRQPRLRAGALNPFSADLVLDVLRTPAYMNGAIERKLTRDDPEPTLFAAPTLVTPEAWRAAHADHRGRKRIPWNAGRKVNRYALSQRVIHVHADGSTSGMYGNSRPGRSLAGPANLRFYRCMAARATATTPAWCDGFGTLQGKQATAVSADLIEARFAMWVLDLIEEPGALAAYAEHADRLLLAEEGAEGVDDVDAARTRLARLEVKRGRYLDAYAEGLSSKEVLAERVTRLDAETETLRDAIERAEGVESQREALTVSIEELLTMSIVDTGERDPNADEYSAAEVCDMLGRAALTTLGPADRWGRTPQLPDWALDEVERYARAFGVEVRLFKPKSPNSDPRRPDVQIEFSPLMPLQAPEAGDKGAQALKQGGISLW